MPSLINRLLVTTTLCTLAATGAAIAGEASLVYTAEIIDVPSSDINCSGAVAGGTSALTKLGEATFHAAVETDDGQLAVFDELPFSFMTLLADTGVAAGFGESFSPAGLHQDHVIRFTPGKGFENVATLPTPSGSIVLAAINDAGQIAFDAPDHSLSGFAFTRPFFYSDETGLVNLGVLHEQNDGLGRVSDMNASGVVVGTASAVTSEDGALLRHAYTWTAEGGMVDIHPGGPQGTSTAISISDTGYIVGAATDSGSNYAFRYTSDGGHEIVHPENPPFEVDYTSPRAVNNHGDVVGVYIHDEPPGFFQAFIYRDATGWQPMGFIEIDDEPAHFLALRDFNDRGEALMLYKTPMLPFVTRAVIYRDDVGLAALHDLVEFPQFADVSMNPIALTEAGQVLVVADGFDANGDLLADDFFAVLTPSDFDPDACDDGGLPGDLNRDGSVDVADLLMLLNGWGECRGTCPSDVDGSGATDTADLLMLLAAWS